ncbi:MAG: zf-HC2 domain-containing protein [Pseudohongiellaceae bacterium]
MTFKNECQGFQLQMDSYLDGGLEPVQEREFRNHMDHCSGCAAELRYATMLLHEVASLPVMDCSEQALEPVNRLAGVSGQGPAGFMERLRNLLDSVPSALQIGAPIALAGAMGVAIALNAGWIGTPDETGVEPSLLAGGEQYTEDEIVQAMRDLEVAIDYLNAVTVRAETIIENRFVMELQDSIDASLRTLGTGDPDATTVDGPI